MWESKIIPKYPKSRLPACSLTNICMRSCYHFKSGQSELQGCRQGSCLLMRHLLSSSIKYINNITSCICQGHYIRAYNRYVINIWAKMQGSLDRPLWKTSRAVKWRRELSLSLFTVSSLLPLFLIHFTHHPTLVILVCDINF